MECKSGKLPDFFAFIFELIDTLWNVNTCKQAGVIGAMGINRYIMECKYLYRWGRMSLFIELIDTLWNVNQLVSIPASITIHRINRYIMECKWWCVL